MPWVSRALLDRADDELRRARKQIKRQQEVITQLQQHNIRIDRKERGMPEEPRKEKEQDPMPPEVRDYLENAFSSAEMRANLEDDIAMARSQGTPWSEIAKVIELEVEDVQPEAG